MRIKEVKITTVRESGATHKVWSPEAAVTYWQAGIMTAPWFDADKECLIALLLNTKNQIVGHTLVSMGTLNAAMVHPREVFRVAVVSAANAILVMHNHPSGDPEPSPDDKEATKQLARAGDVLGIKLLDHIVVSSDGTKYHSMKQYGEGWLT